MMMKKILAGVLCAAAVILCAALIASDAAAAAPQMREAARGVTKTGVEKPLPVVRIFFYVVRHPAQMEALYARMKKRFPAIDEALKNSLAGEKKGALEREQYAVIFGHPKAIETCKAGGYEVDELRGETVITLDRAAPLSQDAEPTSTLGFIVLALPSTAAAPVLKVVAKEGSAMLWPSYADAGADAETLSKEYRALLDSANLEAADVMYKLARWCEEEGLYDRAREHYKRSLLLNPLSLRSAEALRRMAALESLNVAPEGAAQLLSRAGALVSIARYDEALADIDAALKLDEKNAEAHFMKAEYLRTFLRLKEATEELDKAIALDGRRARYFAQRARCYALRGMNAEAEKDVRSAAGIDANDARLLSVRAFLITLKADVEEDKAKQRKMFDEALDLLGRAIKGEPENFELYCERAAIHLAAGNLDFALQDCIISLRLNPYHYFVQHNLAGYYVRTGEQIKAEDAYTIAVTNFPKLPYVYLERGKFRLATSNFRDATLDFSKVIELEPGTADAYYYRAVVSQKLQRNDLAIQDLDKAVEISPKSVLYLWDRGRLNYLGGDLASALADFKAIMDLGAANAAVYYMAGLIHQHRKENEKAAENFRKALEMKPDEKLREEIEARLKEVQG